MPSGLEFPSHNLLETTMPVLRSLPFVPGKLDGLQCVPIRASRAWMLGQRYLISRRPRAANCQTPPLIRDIQEVTQYEVVICFPLFV